MSWVDLSLQDCGETGSGDWAAGNRSRRLHSEGCEIKIRHAFGRGVGGGEG